MHHSTSPTATALPRSSATASERRTRLNINKMLFQVSARRLVVYESLSVLN